MAKATINMIPSKGDRQKEVILPMNEIFWDQSWNSRSDLGTASGGPGEDSDDTGLGELKDGVWTGLIGAILSQKDKNEPGYMGQLAPVFVRIRRPTDTFPKQYKYFGVAGFRRDAALREIAVIQKDKTPMIRAKAWDMTDAEARKLNLLENAARQNLSGPDLAFGVARLRLASPKATQAEIAQLINRSQGYVAKLVGIMTKITGTHNDMPIVDHWRMSSGSGNVTVDEMYAEVANKETPEEQSKKYAALLKKRESGGNSNSSRTNNQKVEAAVEAAKKCGALFGKLARENALAIVDSDTFFFSYLAEFVTLPKKVEDKRDEKTGKKILGIGDRDIASICKAAKDAYAIALSSDVEEDTDDGDAPKTTGKGKGKNGTARATN